MLAVFVFFLFSFVYDVNRYDADAVLNEPESLRQTSKLDTTPVHYILTSGERFNMSYFKAYNITDGPSSGVHSNDSFPSLEMPHSTPLAILVLLTAILIPSIAASRSASPDNTVSIDSKSKYW
jgi:hypothetical protein